MVVTTTTGYRNLQSYSHVYQPVSMVHTSTEAIAYDPAQYRRIIVLDMEETERDNLWIREEIRRVLIQNELLRHRFRYSQVDEERKRAYELERRRREEEERRRWEDEMARRRIEDDERRRTEDELRHRQDEERRRLEEERRRLEAERRKLEEEEKRRLWESQQRPPPMGRFPDTGDIITVYVVRGEGLRQQGRYAPMYVKTGFDGPTAAALPYRTRSAANAGEPVWEESLPEIYYTAGGRNLLLEVYEDEARDALVGTGRLDMRYDENEIHPVEIINKNGGKEGKVYLRYSSRHPPPPLPPPVYAPTVLPEGPLLPRGGGGVLDLEVIEGRNLVDLDILGKSDPYVNFCWGTDPYPFFATKVSKGKNPVWREGVTSFPVPPGTEYVSLMVWDKDILGKDDFMGVHRLPLMPPPNGEFWVPLHPRENEPADKKLASKGSLGELNLRARFVPPAGATMPALAPMPTGPVPTRVRLTLLSAEGLVPADRNGLSDPFVTIGVGNALALKEHKTTVKKKTLNPTWNETFDLMVPENQPYLVFTVFDEDLLSKDDFLGQAAYDCRAGVRQSGTYMLHLMPRANNMMDEKLRETNHGLGILRFRAEWLGAAAPLSPPPLVVPPPPPPPAPKPEYEEIEDW